MKSSRRNPERRHDPQPSEETALEAVLHFARLASQARSGADILPVLSDVLVRHVRADAVALLLIDKQGDAAFLPSPELPDELHGMRIEVDSIADLGQELLAACNRRFAKAVARPLVSDGDLFGVVEMLFVDGVGAANLRLAEGLIDLAGIELGTAARLEEITRSHAEVKALSETLARTEKLRALGQMAAGISHDLKNLLNPLSLHIQVVGRALDRGQTESAKESLGEMKQVLVRGVQTVERLREYSHQTRESRVEPLDLDLLVHEAGEIARPRMSARGGRMNHIVERFGAPPRVMGCSGDVVSALVNLIVNAIDASPGGGDITLRTGASDGKSWVEVADDGAGMSPEIQRRVFEPFFTTKGADGTGLGLAMVHACMQRHDGSVTLDTAPAAGTRFRLWFPVT